MLQILVCVVASACATGHGSTGNTQRPAKSIALNLALPVGLPVDIEQSSVEGIQQLRAGHYQLANRAFGAALRFQPGNANLQFLNALAYHLAVHNGDESQADLAMTGYQLALQFDPGAWWAAYFKGLLDIHLGYYHDAQSDFAHVLLLMPDHAPSMYGLAVASYRMGDVRTAYYAARKAVEADPKNANYLRTAAMVSAAVAQFGAAKSYAARYAKLEPEGSQDAWLHNRLQQWERFHLTQLAANSASGRRNPLRGSGTPSRGNIVSVNRMPRHTPGHHAIAPAPRQVVVDVVFIQSLQVEGSKKGVNLLDGLKIQFNYSAKTKMVPSNQLAQFTAAGSGSSEPFPFSEVITRGLSIPAITYSLNIFNSTMEHSEVLAKPSLIAMDGKTSKFSSGSDLLVSVKGIENGDLKTKGVGISLYVTPKFLSRKQLVLHIFAKRDFFLPQASGTFRESVQTSKNEVTSNVAINFGETLILSGLSEQVNNKSDNKVPLLGDIPIIQYLFNKEVATRLRKSVLILVTPRKPRVASLSGEEGEPIGSGNASDNNSALSQLIRKWKKDILSPPNFDEIIAEIRHQPVYLLFRREDVLVNAWEQPCHLSNAINRAIRFLYY